MSDYPRPIRYPDQVLPTAPVAAAQRPVTHEMPTTFEEAAPNLMPMIQSRAMAEARGILISTETPADRGVIGIPYAEHLAICVAHDAPETKCYLTASDFDKWGVPVAEIVQTAFRNLTQLQNDFRSQFKDGRVFRSFADDTYDATRLLLPHSSFEQLPVRGTHVAMVPHPNLLLITGDDDPEGLSIVLREAQQLMTEPLAIGPFTLRRSEVGWEPWSPDYSPEDRRTFDRLMLDTRERDYARQQKVLADREFARPAADQQFIASYKRLREDVVAGIQTMCVWTKNAQSLLPKTDAIAFVAGKEVKGLVPWSLVADEMKDELKPVGLYPERYAVRSFPTDAQLHMLVEEATRQGVVLDRLR